MELVCNALSTYIDQEIRLTKTDISSAVNSREWFLARIKSVIAQRKDEPVLYAAEPFVFYGSYIKGTKVKQVDELDILVVIDSNQGQFTKGENLIGSGIGKADPNPKYNNKYYKEDNSGISPNKLLNWLKGVTEEVMDPYGGQAPIRNCQAITALISSKDLQIDLVPAGIFLRPDDREIFYNIPKGNRNNGWIETAPKSDINRLVEVSQYKNNFKNIIKVIKNIKDKYNFLVSSFALESAVVDYGETHYWYNNLHWDLQETLRYLSGVFKNGRVNDPLSGSNLLDGVENLTWYADRLENILSAFDNCLSQTDQNKVYNDLKNILNNV
jgi:predicted nucleotidyltransferase